MSPTRFTIIGGGLTGLYAAFLLERQGIDDYVLIEARDAFGGRIRPACPTAPTGVRADEAFDDPARLDLGATWFWPRLQPQLDRLISDLGRKRFRQYEHGDLLVERSSGAPPMRMRGQLSPPTSMRLVDGMGALVGTVPLEQAYAAYQRMKSGQAKFRTVLTMDSAATRS